MINKVVFITGGTRGIGRQIALIFAKAGYQLALNYHHNQKIAQEFQQELMTSFSTTVRLYPGDIGREEEVVNMTEKIYQDFGQLDILILNAGPFIHEEIKLKDCTTDQWLHMMNTNLNSFFYLMKAILPHMERQNWGRIVTLGYDQIERVTGWPQRGAYSAAKTGVAAAVRTLAVEEKEFNITVNMVCPGDIKAQWKEASIEEAEQEKSVEKTEKLNKVKRTDTISSAFENANSKRKATGEDVAQTIYFLCQDSAEYLTGNILNLAGGENIIARKMTEK
ncbi:SDR family oxidoreductase [Enterococcus faecium]|uniref:SDR family oxidoreductase n=1 Tax=Enterococcus faecium TaxID=1352 RepID=UPI00177CCDA1|nr:SDR family oxidoreductase [Enterococcus faecium]MBD9697792.1 SDR family oxidoreductase [Enterococcus faecium]MCO5533813.1 SDR family oxidoreductase [Enterococcus faecium]MDT2324259.1 SDR family oxidoreductase [Enterococcus faecium]MEB8411035.1 SDR family oxidoreductase [Enterococcus faecium]NTR33410.1 SDR family oxidoreductase [Enterococcus faecium]